MELRTKQRGTKELPQKTMSVPLTSEGSFKPKASFEISRDPENTQGIPLWIETDLPKTKERKNDDAWQVYVKLLLKGLPGAGEACRDGS